MRTLYLGIAALVSGIVLIFVGALLYENVVRANEVVEQIGPDNITAAQLVEEMRPRARIIDARARLSAAPNASAPADQQKRSLPDDTLNRLIDRHIIQQEADRRGITVTPAELDDRQRQTVADYNNAVNPAPTPVPAATPEGGVSTPAPSPTTDPNVSPTPFSTPTAVPTLEPSPYGVALGDLLDKNGLTETDLRNELQESVLREKVTKAVGEELVPANQEQVHARHILVATEDQAKEVLQQLQGGADFAALASQLSTDPGSKSKGGDLGWFSRGVMDKPFEDAAFGLQPNELSDVVHGANGYHVIQVLERDPNRAVPDDQLQQLRAKTASDWLNTKHSGPDVKLQLSPSLRDWTLARIGVRP
jgi:parvulin-like peptidyl-prolyl isomerase